MITNKETWEALMKQKPKCAECGKELKRARDLRTKKTSRYIWEVDCKCKSMKNLKYLVKKK